MDGEKEKLKRKKYHNLYMDLAERISKMSFAKRLQVGSVLVKNDNILSYGWNGMPSGWDNNCEDEIFTYDERDTYYERNEWKYDEITKRYSRLKTKPEVLHSEYNCIAKVSRSTNSSEGASLFVTHAPCLDCAKIIHQAGINSVYYRNTYRSEDGINFLNKCGINVKKV